MHYESEDVELIFPSELIRDANLIGEIDERNILILPHEIGNENQFYDGGKNFCGSLVARGQHL